MEPVNNFPGFQYTVKLVLCDLARQWWNMVT